MSGHSWLAPAIFISGGFFFTCCVAFFLWHFCLKDVFMKQRRWTVSAMNVSNDIDTIKRITSCSVMRDEIDYNTKLELTPRRTEEFDDIEATLADLI